MAPNPERLARANRYLEDLNQRARATATYLITADGLCIAASNWRGPRSFVGGEYRFRPYFIDAVKHGVGRFFGIGTISEVPGYFISQPVSIDGRVVGVVVVKLNLEWFQGVDASQPLIVTDDHGVIFPVVGACVEISRDGAATGTRLRHRFSRRGSTRNNRSCRCR